MAHAFNVLLGGEAQFLDLLLGGEALFFDGTAQTSASASAVSSAMPVATRCLTKRCVSKAMASSFMRTV